MRLRSLLTTLCILLVAAGALAVRLPQLDKRPMHADEANQAVKAGDLWETGAYEYDPDQHHGPTLYWLTLPSLWLGGAEDLAGSSASQYRIVPVLFGAGLILLLLLVADGLGRPAAVLAGIFAAASPAMVYYSRYYIQETLLVFFTFATIACAWRYVRSRSPGWAIAAGVFVGLMHATKETWVLAAAAMVAGLALTIAWTRWRDGAVPALRTYLRTAPLVAAAVAAVLVAVAFYSSFGAHRGGPLDSITAYATYLRRGSEGGIHDHPWHYYLALLTWNRPAKGFFWTEGLIVGLAALGVLFSLSLRNKAAATADTSPLPSAGEAREDTSPLPSAGEAREDTSPLPSAGEGSGVRADGTRGGVITPRNTPAPSNAAPNLPFLRFLAFYTLVLTALYAAIPYKTPWCMLSFLHAMTLLAGVGAWSILRAVPTWPLKLVVALLLAAGTAHLGRQCRMLNFRLYADQRNPYAYAHTSTDAVNLAKQMERLAAVSPEGHDMVIHVVTPKNCWPLPWYLRKFNGYNIRYRPDAAAWANEAADLPPPPIIILTPDVQKTVDANLPAAYNRQMMYGLRPGVLVNVYAREDLWDAFLKAAAAAPP